jgi:hypothetical protein
MPQRKSLFPKSQEGNRLTDHDKLEVLLAQYEMYAEMADKNAERRQTANSFFLGLNTAVIGMLGIFQIIQASSAFYTVIWVLPAAGVSLCVAWHRFINSYRKLSDAKFKVIHSIEKKLPLRPYTEEWELLKQGKEPKTYRPYTKIELAILIIFGILNGLALLFMIPWQPLLRLIGV